LLDHGRQPLFALLSHSAVAPAPVVLMQIGFELVMTLLLGLGVAGL
jgi:hypothetical protein